MEQNLFKYIWKHSRLQQLQVLALILLSWPFYFFALDLPKTIVNEAIQRTDEELKTFFRIAFGGEDGFVLFSGLSLNPVPYLLALSFLLLGLVIINGLFKFVINTLKGAMGEQMLWRLRHELFDRVLRFRPAETKSMKPSEVSSMIKDELEPLGGFIGDAFVQPVFLGGQALIAIIFIVTQSFWLGMIAIGIVAIQTFLIPALRRPLIRLGKERQLAARKLAGRVGEVVEGVNAVHVHDTAEYERAELTSRFGKIYAIRFEIFQRKFFVKFLNNLLAQITPFFFYCIGGYFVLQGELNIGQLLAVIAAYKDLPSPIKELIDWDQKRLDVQVKYEQVITQFERDTLIDPELQQRIEQPPSLETQALTTQNLSVINPQGGTALQGLSLHMDLHRNIALIGPTGEGKEALIETLMRLLWPESGNVLLGREDLDEIPTAFLGRSVSYVAPDAVLFEGTIRDNLVYGLKNFPRNVPAGDTTLTKVSQKITGRPLEADADWINFGAAGVENNEQLEILLIEEARRSGLSDDLYSLGLNIELDVDTHSSLATDLLEARKKVQAELSQQNQTKLITAFDPHLYNDNATIGENLLFGTVDHPEFSLENLAKNKHMLACLQRMGAYDDLVKAGHEIAKTMVEIFADLAPGHSLFEQFSFISSDDLPLFDSIVRKAEKSGLHELNSSEQNLLVALPFPYIEPKHRLGLLSADLKNKLVAVRDDLAQHVEEAGFKHEPYDPALYNPSISVLDNILFGRINPNDANAVKQIRSIIDKVIYDQNLWEDILSQGLNFRVGTGGKLMTARQRLLITLARALIKRPKILLLNNILGTLGEQEAEDLLERLLAKVDIETLIWSLEKPEWAKPFDWVIHIESGKVKEQDEPANLVLEEN